ncbi:class I SAM-dependent methyltransferase [Amycolatopsis sp. WGS_07]|uniref:class I SAM-dependent methyltransferase n=1 Tax=Amycolatopsis sp. WGS_07 TaxID=3076764 RepID=UPI003873B7AE
MTSYSDELADIYDLVFNCGRKNYDGEAAEVVRQVRARFPGARSLLDVGCGTGTHLERLCAAFDRVEGVEPAPAMRRVAQRKLPSVPIHAADMREFRLGRSFDAVCCMHGPIGYMTDEAQLRGAVRRMAEHLMPGGVLVLDPWWFPETFVDGYVMAEAARDDSRSVARMSHSVRTSESSMCITAKYLVGDSTGIREFAASDVLSLFRKDQYADALAAAGLGTEYVPAPETPRGLFIGIKPEGEPTRSRRR